MTNPTRIRLIVALASLLLPAAVAAQARSVYLEDLTWTEVRDAIAHGTTSAIIYTGSTEQNGPHMVLGKHNFLAHFVAGRIATRLGTALVYPTIPFAPTGNLTPPSGHMRFPGSITVPNATYAAVVRSMAESAISAGFRHVFLMGDHGGGQDELKAVAEELDRLHSAKGARVHFVADLYRKSGDDATKYLAEHHLPAGQHASLDDTSELMYIDTANRWIRKDKLAASDSLAEPSTGVRGDPRKASAAMGEIFIGQKVTNAVAEMKRQLAGAGR